MSKYIYNWLLFLKAKRESTKGTGLPALLLLQDLFKFCDDIYNCDANFTKGLPENLRCHFFSKILIRL